MSCSAPPPLSDDEITAALEGQAEPAVLQHLSRCPACAARLAQAQRVEEMLMNRLFRWDCPTPQQLGQYYLKHLTEPERQGITRHLEWCVRCQSEIETLQTFMGADSVSDERSFPKVARSFRPRLGELIARLVPQPLTPALRGS